VPVDYASFKLHDALLTRLSNDGALRCRGERGVLIRPDSMEKSLSTFAAEMATSAMILGQYQEIMKTLMVSQGWRLLDPLY